MKQRRERMERGEGEKEVMTDVERQRERETERGWQGGRQRGERNSQWENLVID